jgi:hypothetical protein
MGYLKKNVNENSIRALKPNNRLQGDLPKKRLNVTIAHEVYEQLKATGNVSGTIEKLAKEYLIGQSDSSLITVKLKDIISKVDAKESGYKSNSASKLIAQLKDLIV